MANEKNLIPFVPGQSGNPNGRPRKTLTIVNDLLKEKGYQRATSAQVLEAYELCLNLDEEAIKELTDDKECPFLLKAVAKQMLSDKSGDILERILDRAHGKAKSGIEVSGPEGGPITFSNKIVFK